MTALLAGAYDSPQGRDVRWAGQLEDYVPGMSTDFDLYAALGVGQDASPDEIRGAYRRAARASHPDLHPGDATAAERFKRVQIAYEVLGDPQRRAAYDAPRTSTTADVSVSLARELGETVRAIRVMARRSGFRRRVNRLIRYLERL